MIISEALNYGTRALSSSGLSQSKLDAKLLIKNQLDSVNQVEESISETTINNSESLDEVISNYEANTQN